MMTQVKWLVERSFMVNHPEAFVAARTPGLEKKLQLFANTYEGEHPIGKLRFTYELDGEEHPTVCRVTFIDKDGKSRRFMKLKRIEVEHG